MEGLVRCRAWGAFLRKNEVIQGMRNGQTWRGIVGSSSRLQHATSGAYDMNEKMKGSTTTTGQAVNQDAGKGKGTEETVNAVNSKPGTAPPESKLYDEAKKPTIDELEIDEEEFSSGL